MAAPGAHRAGLVLVVDDESMLPDIMERALCEAGYSVLRASSGRHALALVLKNGAPPDVLVTDICMEGLKGVDLAALITERHPATRVLLVSAGDPDYKEVAWRFLRKPFSLAQLVGAVDQLMASGGLLSAQGMTGGGEGTGVRA